MESEVFQVETVFQDFQDLRVPQENKDLRDRRDYQEAVGPRGTLDG